jgi:6-carboxyhexanoate--CoA ligase
MSSDLFSIRMRASLRSRHVSGAERITAARAVNDAVQQMLERARGRREPPDEIVITVERIDDATLRTLRALDVTAVRGGDVASCRGMAARALAAAGVSSFAAAAAMAALEAGPAPAGGNMRGAIIMDALTAERLEPDPERGIRASRFDWSDAASAKAREMLSRRGLAHFRTREALALATKAASAPSMAAELCWSDDPEYTAGYVASRMFGYLRFPLMKEPGCGAGGRVFFVRRRDFDLPSFRTYLQQTPVIIDDMGDVIESPDLPRAVTGT